MNPWALADVQVAVLMTKCGMSYQQIAETPPRILYNAIDFVQEQGGYSKANRPGPMDISIPPAQFQQLLKAKNNG